MEWEVEYTDEFGDWLDELASNQQDAVADSVKMLRQGGPSLGRPRVETINDSDLHNLKELRVNEDGYLRILFMFDPRRCCVLLLGGDKTGQWKEWYRWAIPEAERIYRQYLSELREEGLL